MEPDKLNAEVKWRSMISLFLNYVKNIYKILFQELDEDTNKRIIDSFNSQFWGEQSQAFIDLFDIKPGTAINAQTIKRIIAVLFDIKYVPIKETENEVIDEEEYLLCPVRIALEPILPSVCSLCESWGRFLIHQLDPSFTHKVEIKNNICRHITIRNKENS